MDDEVARLRTLLEAAEKRSAEEQRRRENAEIVAKEEQRKRKEQEEDNKKSRPQALPQYLEACHSLSLAIQVVTEKSLTTQGDTTNPTGRVYPRRIVPWDDYPTRQDDIWDRLSLHQPFCSDPVFPSSHQLDYVASDISPIASEMDLRHFERDTVEKAVWRLVNEAYKHEPLRVRLGILGSVTFESHTNLGDTVDAVSQSVEHMTMAENTAANATTTPGPKRARARRRARRGKKGPADQFCVYRRSDGRNVPALAIEYKAPHKLTRDEVVAGLRGEIQPERDVINKNGNGFAFASRRLTAAVVTQLFSYMVDKGIQYGYVCTGETFIFLHIPDDPSIVYYSVCVPNLDVMDDDENRLHRTAVAQVFGFVLQALCSPPPPLAWHDSVNNLDIWAVEFEDVLRDIPETERKAPKVSPYRAQRWKGFTRSPIKTRSRCRLEDSNARPHKKDESEDEPPTSPSASRLLRSSKKAPASTGATAKDAKRGGHGGGGTSGTATEQTQKKTQTRIQDRAFCTQECLSGLASGGPMDGRCPNFGDHQRQHISLSEFRTLIRAQLARDRGPDADAMPLYLSGSVGALFKVRLSSHGYTLVAKGVEYGHLARLQHEKTVYDQLRTIQGKYVPVCLGNVDLVLPYYYDGGVYEHFLFLGWAGRPLFDLPSEADKATIVNTVSAGFKAVHNLHVLHGDAEPRNILYNADNGYTMIVDFERAKLSNQEPLGPINPNRKRKHDICQKKQGRNNKFTTELQSIVQGVKRSIE